ncbi:MAG: NTPase [Calditrichia bacterium]
MSSLHIKNFLITGKPGVGKTTFIRKLALNLGDVPYAGFFTEEIRREGKRLGFRIETFQGLNKILAHVDFHAFYRVSRYGVNLSALEEVITHLQHLSSTPPKLWLIDEIGKMESFSPLFRQFVENLLGSEQGVVASISISGGGWIGQIRNRPDVRIFELTLKNRDTLVHEFSQTLKARLS